jgi:uncharacterized cupin superfamily protein
MVDPRTVALTPSPIRKDWILEGNPETSSAEIARTNDGSTQVFVWRTTKSRFNWFYDFDEVVSVLDGEMFLIDGANAPSGKPERRIGPGDVVFFPAGSTATWRVPDHVRKIATMRHPLPGPIDSLFRLAKVVKSWVTPTSAMAAL